MSTDAASGLRFLTVGVPADHPSVPPDMQPKVAEMLAKADEQFAHCNFPVEHVNVSPEDSSEFARRLSSERVDAVVIGNGVRSNIELTYFLEQLVELIHTKAPQCKVLFNTTPMDVVDAIHRWYPQVHLDDAQKVSKDK